MSDPVCRCDNLFLPLVILGTELVSPEPVLSRSGADDLFIVNMQGNAVSVRQLLGQYVFVVPLDLFQMTGTVDNAVQPDAVAAEQPALTG